MLKRKKIDLRAILEEKDTKVLDLRWNTTDPDIYENKLNDLNYIYWKINSLDGSGLLPIGFIGLESFIIGKVVLLQDYRNQLPISIDNISPYCLMVQFDEIQDGVWKISYVHGERPNATDSINAIHNLNIDLPFPDGLKLNPVINSLNGLNTTHLVSLNINEFLENSSGQIDDYHVENIVYITQDLGSENTSPLKSITLPVELYNYWLINKNIIIISVVSATEGIITITYNDILFDKTINDI